MTIEIVTDCIGIKQDAIRSVFSERFNPDDLELILLKDQEFQTPLTQDSFFLSIKRRFQWIKENHENPDVYITTIQKGYYCLNGIWYLTACVGVSYPMFDILTAMTSSVPVPQACSNKKLLNLSKNISDILQEKYPDWDKENASVYTLLTGEEEIAWLAQPLRHCLKAVASF